MSFWNQKSGSSNSDATEELKDRISYLEKSIKINDSNYSIKVNEISTQHVLDIKEKEFEMKHFKDEEIKTKDLELNELKESIAVLKKENEMLDKIVDLNSDVIDIKDLVKKLIDKLPEVNLQNLTIQNGSEQNK